MVSSIQILTRISLVLAVIHLARLSSQNDSMFNDFKGTDTVITVKRGVRSSSDRLDICSQDSAVLEQFVSRSNASKMMKCDTVMTSCERMPDLLKGYRCSCSPESPTYVGAKQRCVNTGWLRKGCAFRFGSWRFKRGWKWNTDDDPLLSLYIDPGYAISGSINVSKSEYSDCTLVNVTVLNKSGKWEKFVNDPTTVRFNIYRQYFQISWQTDDINLETKQKLSGRIFRLFISCNLFQFGEIDGIKDPLVSCLTFKATGNITYTYEKEHHPSSTSGSANTVAIALGVTFSLLFVVIGILTAIIIYQRRRGTGSTFLPRFLARHIVKP